MGKNKVFLTLMLLFIMVLICLTGLLSGGDTAGISIVWVYAGVASSLLVPVSAQTSMILSTQKRE